MCRGRGGEAGGFSEPKEEHMFLAKAKGWIAGEGVSGDSP